MATKSPYVENPKSGRYAKYPGGDRSKRDQARTDEGMTIAAKAVRDKFIEGMLMGLPRYKAAMYAGISSRSAMKRASEMWHEPYVQERFKKLREEMAEQDLITKKELLLNVKSIGFDDREAGNTRVSASSLIADMMGWKVNKMQLTGANSGPLQVEDVTLDPKKLSKEALEEILNALPPAAE